MTSNQPSKIIIAGGGITGLTLAVILERFDIDYVLLEAYRDIAPNVGASIGLTPNCLRIYDQLGVYDAIERLPHADIEELCVRDKNGHAFKHTKLPFAQSGKRHGYTTRFFPRQWLLQVLYDSLQHKEKVLTNKKVISVKQLDGGVEVLTEDGGAERGSILIGADGVKSTVREQMYTIAGKAHGEDATANGADTLACSYQCSFGIAQHVPGWNYSQLNVVPGDNLTLVATSGSEGRVYWFVFARLPKTVHGRHIPKYTREDEVAFAKKYANHRLTESITFGQIFSKRTSSTLTPLHEGVQATWSSNPIGAQGGNSVVEAGALFINALRQKLDVRRDGLAGLTNNDVAEVFAFFQKAQRPRATRVVARSHTLQALAAFEQRLLSRFILHVVVPWQHDELALAETASILSDAPRIDTLPIPFRPKAIPFVDELPAKPVTSKSVHLFVVITTLGASFGLLWLVANIQFPYIPTFTWGGGEEPLDRKWLPTKSLNNYALYVVSLCSHPILDETAGPTAHLIYLLAQMISPNLIYTIEANRVGNRGTPLASPFLIFGIMGIAALAGTQQYWTIISVLFGHVLPTGRSVPLEVAHSLTPALALGFVLPAVLMFLPVPNTKIRQDWNALWQFGTFLFISLTDIFARVLRWHWRRTSASLNTVADPKTNHADTEFERYRNRDAAALQSAYICACAVQSVSHFATLLYVYYHPDLFVLDFFRFPSPWSNWSSLGLSLWILNVLKYDLALYVAGSVVYSLYAIWKLRQMGYITNRECATAVLCVILGQPLLGSGAAWAALWYWREGVFLRLSTLN
ncbi:FAD-dependent urate hydroxylase 3 [Colletotrichum chlorophyti]|uniref:FAD-dependent urate hydroxylase 3 n=1 Tax=Colletotrichum chlorophyti TaxID=708187 RepID=A0A1Q8RQR2_9PEZI|nr:FAD-dependent urate hydroxylase 3 [Colletotrichum chlorophyti]